MAVPSTLDRKSHQSGGLDEHPAPLRIAIVGAGIGGLAAAIGLRRNGHEVHVRCFFPLEPGRDSQH